MNTHFHEDPRIVAAAERQMQSWVHVQEAADRRVLADVVWRRLADCGRTYVAISRESGTDAAEIAGLLGQKLHWEVLDKTLVDRVAERFRDPRSMLDVVDETESNWIYDVLGTWMDDQIVTHDKYVAHLTRVVRAAARRGKVVLVGRRQVYPAAGKGLDGAHRGLGKIPHRPAHATLRHGRSQGPAVHA